jgi:very-short-patch-repair endonuclease
MSLPEVLLWQVLRRGPGGLKFRRQHPTGPYDLDFYCGDARLAIEIDGQAHERGDRPARDAARDRWLREKGIHTLRIPAVEVLRNLEGVLQLVAAEATARLPLHHRLVLSGRVGTAPAPPRACLGEGDHGAKRHGGGADAEMSPPPPPDGGGPPPRDELGED